MATRSTSIVWSIVAVCAAVVLTLAAPQQWRGWLPSFLGSAKIHLGLDLAGGTQLDFRISEDEIQSQIEKLEAELAELERVAGSPERMNEIRVEIQIVNDQRANLIEAIRTVLERRINALGVSEATITPSYVGQEKHLLVECPGVIDVQECIATVGKTIQLEFKEEFTEATEEFAAGVRTQVAAVLRRARGEETLAMLGQDLEDELGVGYQDSRWFFRDQLPKGLDAIWNRSPKDGVLQFQGSVSVQRQTEEGDVVNEDVPGLFLAEVTAPRTASGKTVNEAPAAFSLLAKTEPNLAYAERKDLALDDAVAPRMSAALRSMQAGDLQSVAMDDGTAKVLFLRSLTPGREEMEASHILIAYRGASATEPGVARTKEEALAKAQDLRRQLAAGANFADLARRESDGPSKKDAGRLGTFSRNAMVPAFEAAAFALGKGEISEPVETPFGYHIIRADSAPAMTVDHANVDELSVAGADAATRAEGIIARMQNGDVRSTEDALAARFLFFSLRPSGWKDTALDGKHFRTATVTLDPTTNIPVVQILFDEEGGRIFQELTKRNVGKRIAIFVGGELVSAPTVQQEIAGGSAVITGSSNFDEARLLAQDLNTGAIPAPIHLSGQRTVEPTLGAEALGMSLQAALIGIVVLMLYMLVMYRALGVLANLALLIYALLFLALLKLPLFFFTSQHVVLTLAGAAGMILSIGMAVDTNVLVFERVKEEIRKGKSLRTAIEVGFDKAWPSIRDSNVSTLITCGLLFMIGTSIVRGFAITLGIGVLISMFTGMIIARYLARKIAETPLAERTGLFVSMRNPA